MTSSYDTIILGGGVAGLAAAIHLVDAGQKPLLLEADKTPGGRARSHDNSAFGETLDNGPHLLMGAYQHTLELLTQLNTRHLLISEKNIRFNLWDQTHQWHSLTCPNWPAPLHLLAALHRFPGVTRRERFTALLLGKALLSHSSERDKQNKQSKLEQQSVTQWLHQHRQQGSLFQRLWAPLCLATLNEPPASANAALFATVLKKLFLSHRQAAQPLIPSVPLSQLIATPAQRYIEAAGGAVCCGERVTRLSMNTSRITAIHTQRQTWYQPKTVICTLPYFSLKHLLPEWSQKNGWHRLQSAPIVTVHLCYPQSLYLPHPMVGLPHEQSQWIFDRGRITAGNRQEPATKNGEGGRFSAILSGAYRERTFSRETLITMFHQDLQRLLPELPQNPPPIAQVIKEHRATFAAWPESSQYRPNSTTPWQNFWLAGDWTNTGLPATIEGAVQSGIHAARIALTKNSNKKL